MNHRHPKLRWLTGVVLAAALAAPLYAQGHGRSHGVDARDPAEMFDRLAGRLNLGEDQRADLQSVFERHREEARPLMEQLRQRRGELEAVIRGETLDESAVRQAAGEVAELEIELALERAAFQQELRRILTPEQLAEFEELHENRRDRSKERGSGAWSGSGSAHR